MCVHVGSKYSIATALQYLGHTIMARAGWEGEKNELHQQKDGTFVRIVDGGRPMPYELTATDRAAHDWQIVSYARPRQFDLAPA